MAQTLYPTAIVAKAGLGGLVTDIDDDPASPDGNWCTSGSTSTYSGSGAGTLTLAGQGVGVSDGSGLPTYTPYLALDWQEGDVGDEIQYLSQGWNEGQRCRYSDDISGPHGQAKCVKAATYGGGSGFGGVYSLGSTGMPAQVSRADLLSDGDMWIRLYHYFPTAFCAGYGSGGDGWGSTKWIRLQFSGGQRLTYSLGGFSGGSCKSASLSPTVYWLGNETGSGDFFWGTPGETDSGEIITRNAWHALQFQIHWSGSSSWVRGWVDDTYVGEASGGATLPASGSLTELVLGDYWNGEALQTTSWYIAELIVTRETPNTLDSGSRPYIAPSTKVSDF